MTSALSFRNVSSVSFLFIAVVGFLLGTTTIVRAQATSTPRLEQLIKDTKADGQMQAVNPGFESNWDFNTNYQYISCQDLSGQIQNVTLSLEALGTVGRNVRVALIASSGFPAPYESNDILVSGAKKDYSFNFMSLVDVSTICPSQSGYVKLGMHVIPTNGGGFGIYRYGSALSNAYRDASYDSDGSSSVPRDLYFILNGIAEVNHPPVLQVIGDHTTLEGNIFTIIPAATDIDGGSLPITVSGLPEGATFINNKLSWTPRFDQAGAHSMTFTVTDDGNQGLFSVLQDSETVTITVQDTVPDLHRLEQLVKDTKADGQMHMANPGFESNWNFNTNYQRISCEDISGQILDVALSLEAFSTISRTVRVALIAPSGFPAPYESNDVVVSGSNKDYTFTFRSPVDVSAVCPNQNGYVLLGMHLLPASFSGIYRYGSASSTAYRDASYDSDTFSGLPRDLYFIINPSAPTNQSPVLNLINNQTVNENQQLQFTVTATDPDAGDTVTLSANNLPAGASFDPQTGVFTWTPGYADSGVYPNIEFVATDNGNPMASTSEMISITVNDVNRAPVLESVGNKTVNENQVLLFTLSATDPDGDALTYSATNLPAGATFDPQTRTFSWTPTYAQAGNYENVEFTVTDDGSPMQLAVEDITITVGNTNRPPVFASIGSQEVLENNALSFAVSASDPDGDTVTLSASSTPTGATFDPGTGTFSWIPSLSQAGIYVVAFKAVDDGVPSETSMLEVVITVGDNPTPTEQAQNLVDVVVSAPVSNTLENSYLANLNKVGIFIEQGKIQPAINQLNAFIQKVEQDYAQGIITLQQRDDFIAQAQQLIDALN